MALSRRGFLAGIGAVLAAPAIVRVQSIMPVRAIARPCNILTLQEITRQAVRLFVNSNSFLANLERQLPDEFAFGHYRIGDHVRISLPRQFSIAA